MAAFDLFGLKKDAPAPAAAPAATVVSPSPTLWKRAAMADAALLVVCLALAGWRVSAHLSSPPPPVPAPRKPPVKPVEAPKAEPAKPEPKKEEPKPEARKPEPKKAEPKKEEPRKAPLGSPSIHAAPAPRRDPAPIGPPKAEPAKAEAAAAAEPAKKKSATRPVPFSHEDAEAKEVYLVGPFLVRSGGRKTLFKDSKGVWQTTVYLNVGQTYKYRFEVVGEKGKRLTAPQKVEVLDAD